MNWYKASQNSQNHLLGYGGPVLNPQYFLDSYRDRSYIESKDLYGDVDMELDNLNIHGPDVIWFDWSINPNDYKPSTSVEEMFTEDFNDGIIYFDNLVEWINDIEEPFDNSDLISYDKSKMECIKKLLWNFEYDVIDEKWDDWGPYAWNPDIFGEWERCRNIYRYDFMQGQEFPVAIFNDGSVLDGAHRLAVSIHERSSSYPALIGFHRDQFEDLSDGVD